MADVIAPVNGNTVVMTLTREAMVAASEKSHRVVGAVSGVRVSRGAVLSSSTRRTSTSYNGVFLLCSVLLLTSYYGAGTEAMATSGHRITLQTFSTRTSWENAEKHCQRLGGHLNDGMPPDGFNETTFFSNPQFPEGTQVLAGLYSFENNKNFAHVNRNNAIKKLDRIFGRDEQTCSFMKRTGRRVHHFPDRCQANVMISHICEVHDGSIQPTLVCSNKRYYYHTISFSLQHATESCKRIDTQARLLQLQDATDLNCGRQLFQQPGMGVNSSTIPVYGTNITHGCQFYSVDKNTTVNGTCNLWRPVICVAECPRRCDNTTEFCQKLSDTVYQCMCKLGLARQSPNDTTCLTHGQLLILNGAVENKPTNVTVYMFDSNTSTWIFQAIHPVILTTNTTLSNVIGSELFAIATHDVIVFLNPPFRTGDITLIRKLYRNASDCIISSLQYPACVTPTIGGEQSSCLQDVTYRQQPADETSCSNSSHCAYTSWPDRRSLGQGSYQLTFLVLSKDGVMIRTPPIPFRGCPVVMKVTTTFSPTTSSLIDVTLSPTTDSFTTDPTVVSVAAANDGTSVGIITASVAGGVVLLLVFLFILVVFYRSSKKVRIGTASIITGRRGGQALPLQPVEGTGVEASSTVGMEPLKTAAACPANDYLTPFDARKLVDPDGSALAPMDENRGSQRSRHGSAREAMNAPRSLSTTTDSTDVGVTAIVGPGGDYAMVFDQKHVPYEEVTLGSTPSSRLT